MQRTNDDRKMRDLETLAELSPEERKLVAGIAAENKAVRTGRSVGGDSPVAGGPFLILGVL